MRSRALISIILILCICLPLTACGDDDASTSGTSYATTTSTTSSTAYPSDISRQGLVINEVCTKNVTGITDSLGLRHDWIEIFNPTDRAILLGGAGLSNDPAQPFKYIFPSDLLLQPGEYHVVFAAGKGMMGDEYAPFKVSSTTDKLFLTDTDGSTIDTMYVPSVAADITYGRMSRDGSRGFMIATPGAANGAVLKLSADIVTFSHESGFYDSDFFLTLSVPAGYTVYYTTDCTVPTKSSRSFTAPLHISDASEQPDVFSQIVVTQTEQGMWYPLEKVDKSTVIRAIVYDNMGNKSDVLTKTYFVGFDDKDGYENIAVMSLVTAPSNLYDPTKGIFVNGNWSTRGDEAERPVSMSFFDEQGSFVWSQECGIRVRGASSRAYQQKSLNLYARDIYGYANEFEHTFFDGVDFMKSVILRYDGSLKFPETLFGELMEDRAVATADGRPCVVFLDGEYYGVYTILEKFTKQYVEEHYGIDRDDVVIIKKGALEEGTQADLNDYNSFISFVTSSSMANEANYRRACEMVDIQSFIDFVCFQVYSGNADWSMKQNIACFKSRTVDPSNPYADGKWRFMIYDTDFCMGIWSRTDYPFTYATDSFTAVMPFTKTFALDVPLVKAFMKNHEFCDQFVDSFLDIANYNFAPTRAIGLMNEIAARYAPNMENYYRRFGSHTMTEQDYLENVSTFAVYFEQRFDHIVPYLAQHFGCSGDLRRVTVDTVGQGSVDFSTLSLTDTYTGRYFTGCTLDATAIPASGSRFVGWQVTGAYVVGDLSSPTAQFIIQASDATIIAVFEE